MPQNFFDVIRKILYINLDVNADLVQSFGKHNIQLLARTLLRKPELGLLTKAAHFSIALPDGQCPRLDSNY